MSPNLADAYAWRGLSYAESGELLPAIADCNKALRINPGWPQPIWGAARPTRGGRPTTTRSRITGRLSGSRPTTPTAYCGRGASYLRKGLFDKAIADYTQAIRLAPSWAAAYEARAHAYEKKGDQAKAKDDRSRAKKLQEPKTEAKATPEGEAKEAKARKNDGDRISLAVPALVHGANRSRTGVGLHQNICAQLDQTDIAAVEEDSPIVQAAIARRHRVISRRRPSDVGQTGSCVGAVAGGAEAARRRPPPRV